MSGAEAAGAPRVALVTCAEVPDLDDEGRLLLGALEARGLVVEPAVWDDDAVDWASYDVAVVRSTWDYAERRDDFVAWAERAGAATRLLNDATWLTWSTDKRYLAELAGVGLPVVPSQFVTPEQAADPGFAHDHLAVEHVVKPAVGAGSRDAVRLGPDEQERSLAHLRAVAASGRTVLVQPYLAGVDTDGETALVFVDGRFAHALRKGALLALGTGPVDGLFAQEEMTPRDPSAAELALAEAVVAELLRRRPDAVPLYARVDLLPGPDGPLLLELELAEPSLFLDHVEGSAEAFADAITARTTR